METAGLVGFIVKREASIGVRSFGSTRSSLLNAIQTSSRATQQIQGEALTVNGRRCQDLLCFTAMCLNQRWHSCAERRKQAGISSSDSFNDVFCICRDTHTEWNYENTINDEYVNQFSRRGSSFASTYEGRWNSKGRFTHSMPCPCRFYAMPRPCPAPTVPYPSWKSAW